MAVGQRARLKVGSAGLRAQPDAMALWLLVGIELGLQLLLRRYFRRQHGG